MKQAILTLLSLILIIAFVSCGSDSDKEEKKENTDTDVSSVIDTTDLPAATIDESEKTGTYNLAYNFKEGDTFKYRLSTISKSIRDVVVDTAFTNNLVQNITRVVEIKTLKVNDDSTAELQCTLTSASIDADMNGQKVTYRSGQKLDSLEVRRFYEFESILNNPFVIKVNNRGKLLGVTDTGNILDKMIEISGIVDTLSAADKQMMKENIKQNLIIPLMTQVIREFPGKTIELGTSWDKQLPPSKFMVFTLNYTNHFKVDDFQKFGDDLIAVINGNTTTEIEGETKLSNKGINYEFTKPVSTASGKIFFNLDRGLVQKSKTKTHLEISYKMEVPMGNEVRRGSATEISINENILELL